jgi:hypothetical protein
MDRIVNAKEIGALLMQAKFPDFSDFITELELHPEASETEIKSRKNKMGRPPLIGVYELRELRQAFLMGFTDKEACAYAGIALRTFYDFQTRYVDFSHYKDEWKENPVLKAKATLYKNLEKVGTATWFLERKKRDEFATRQELTGGDAESRPVQVAIIAPKSDGTTDNTGQEPDDTIQTVS